MLGRARNGIDGAFDRGVDEKGIEESRTDRAQQALPVENGMSRESLTGEDVTCESENDGIAISHQDRFGAGLQGPGTSNFVNAFPGDLLADTIRLQCAQEPRRTRQYFK